MVQALSINLGGGYFQLSKSAQDTSSLYPATMSDSSDLSSAPSEDETDLQLKNKGGILRFFSKVKDTKAKRPKKKVASREESPAPPEREASPPHEFILADNPDIAV